jgi:hypothetical protein
MPTFINIGYAEDVGIKLISRSDVDIMTLYWHPGKFPRATAVDA